MKKDSSHMVLRVLLIISLGYNRKYLVQAQAHIELKRLKYLLEILMNRGLVRDGDSGLFVTDEGARVAMHYLKALEGIGLNVRDRKQVEGLFQIP